MGANAGKRRRPVTSRAGTVAGVWMVDRRSAATDANIWKHNQPDLSRLEAVRRSAKSMWRAEWRTYQGFSEMAAQQPDGMIDTSASAEEQECEALVVRKALKFHVPALDRRETKW